jgi:phosphate-selective porin OprO and OprP
VRIAGACTLLLALAPLAARSGEAPSEADLALASLEDSADASAADGDVPRRQLVSWNSYEGPYMTMRVGGGFLYDYTAYGQDEDSKTQMSLNGQGNVRDSRLVIKGAFPKIAGLSYTFGYMYDTSADQWKFRQTGLQYEIPKLDGRLFVGRTKEGLSTNKLMVGYQGWTIERAAINDAFVPILADGLKWMGNSPDGRVVYSLGWFKDGLSETESFNKNDEQVVARAVLLPFLLSDPNRLLHLAAVFRWAKAEDGFLQYRSKPEAYAAQSYAIDTGKFAANHSDIVGLEAYYRPGPLMFGAEYMINYVSSPETHNPTFHGGEIFAAYTITGEIRPYNTKGAFFDRISPNSSVFDGGRGAWEAVLRYSYADLDSGTIHGGKFWRITPVLNWHMSDNVRLEIGYGYGVLDRFNVKGATQFFQTRLQLQL